MTEVYKSGNDVDYYEKVLASLFKKVLERLRSRTSSSIPQGDARAV